MDHVGWRGGTFEFDSKNQVKTGEFCDDRAESANNGCTGNSPLEARRLFGSPFVFLSWKELKRREPLEMRMEDGLISCTWNDETKEKLLKESAPLPDGVASKRARNNNKTLLDGKFTLERTRHAPAGQGCRSDRRDFRGKVDFQWSTPFADGFIGRYGGIFSSCASLVKRILDVCRESRRYLLESHMNCVLWSLGV